MKRSLIGFFALSVIGCSYHPFPSRVSDAKKAVVAFLIDYARIQTITKNASGEYQPQLQVDGSSPDWTALSADYDRVIASEYSCRFNADKSTFAVTCVPDPKSGLQLSFFLDQSLAIRLSGGIAGPRSSRLWLTADEERKLFEFSDAR